ncbi:IST1 homolog [Cimex lectularius]|uniref:IST1 homolog n=1 Tax=Cimex lectularius TaxID=79782 RepID=A0A8I6RTH0_CIMLE|nr:IST1 homolog [Cimex lectularius]
MFSSGANYPKLKTNLRLVLNRLKLLEKKKSELGQKARKEIADYITDGKCERAKIKVEQIIREDYMVEAMELLEMYCDLLLSRFGLLQEMKELDSSLMEAVSSILWVAPRFSSEVAEFKVISDQLTAKYGKKYAEECRTGRMSTISEKLRHKLSVQAPPKILIEKYLIEISKIYHINYEPDPQVMKEYEQAKGMDALLFDSNGPLSNNLDMNVVRPPGFIDYPMQPTVPFNYPSPPSVPQMPINQGAMGGPSPPGITPPHLYNIPPTVGNENFQPLNITKTMNSGPPPYPSMPSDKNMQDNNEPKPMPRSKLSPELSLPDLPSVPNDNPLPESNDSDEEDFSDLARRFEELKKRK